MIVTVTFGELLLNQVSDRSVRLGLALNSIDYDHEITIGSAQRAGGNWTADATPGMQRVAKVNLVGVSDVNKAQLLRWYTAGEALWLRAPDDGTKFAGYIENGATFSPIPIGNYWGVPFTFRELTIPEAV